MGFYFSLSLTLEMPVCFLTCRKVENLLRNIHLALCVTMSLCVFSISFPQFLQYLLHLKLQHHTTNDLLTNSWILNNSSNELLN